MASAPTVPQSPTMGIWPQQGAEPPAPITQSQHSIDNPQRGGKEVQLQKSGLTSEQEELIVSGIIHPYRTQWATARIQRMPEWLKYAEFYKGNQVLGWDPITRTYFDAVAAYRQSNQGEDTSYLEKYVNNLTQTIGRNFTSAVARAVPPVVVIPQNAENLADMTTAKAAQEAIGIVEEANNVKNLLGHEAHLLYLYGVYFKWTRFKIDGSWVGYKDEPQYGDINVNLSKDHYHCLSCGADTDEDQIVQSGAMQCGNCGSQLNPQDFYPGEQDTAIGQTGTKKKANGMPKWSVYGPLQVDTDPTADEVCQVPLLALEMECDAAEVRAIHPGFMKEITEGTESATNDNATYERLVRTIVYSSNYNVTADIFTSRVTYTQVWVQPTAYLRVTDNPEFTATMQKLFPDGCKVSMVGQLVLEVKPAVLQKEWSACKLHHGYGLFPPSVAKNVVPFNERFNNVSNILDDYMERCATGITLVDTRRIDAKELSGKSLTGGVLNPTPTRGEGVTQPLSDAIYHFDFKMDPGLFNYLDRLWNYCQLISGVPPQVSGTGTQEGVETAKGQAQMLDQAMGALGDIYDRIKIEHAQAGQNAIECLQENMQYTGSLWSVIEENGSEFRNNYVHLDEMQGKVRTKTSTDEGLPLSAEQKREWINNMIKMAQDENPIALEWFDVPSNQEMANQYSGLPGSVVPHEAQRSKTLQDIRKLLQAGQTMPNPMPMMGPNGQPVLDDDGTPRIQPPIAPEKWVEDYPTLRATVTQFCAENSDVKDQNPVGFAYIIAFFRLACQYEAEVQGWNNKLQMQAKQQGQPPPPAPNPAIQAAEAQLVQAASESVQRLEQLGSMPPLGPSMSIAGQVSANKEVVDSALKAAQAVQ